MQIGLLGKANVGKSTFFSAATAISVPSGNFPFTTIEPNVGVAYVETDCACKHFDISHQNDLCRDGTRLVSVKLVDVAGLVPGAHEGKGLGNQFLDNARQAEVLIHVVDAAEPLTYADNPLQQASTILPKMWRLYATSLIYGLLTYYVATGDKIIREVGQKRAKPADAIAERFSGLGVKPTDVHRVLTAMNFEGRIHLLGLMMM